MSKPLFQAIAILVGTIIGAGILGIPAVIAEAGFWTGMLVILILGFALMLLHLYVGEIALRTKGRHQLSGYAEKYLGKYAKIIMSLSMVLAISGALTAYIIGEGAAMQAIFGGNSLLYSLGFFIIFAALVYKGLRFIGESEIWLNIGMILAIILICVVSLFYVKTDNFTGFSLWKFFIPYGVIFFAFVGTAAIPEMKAELINNKKKLKKAIIIGSLIPLIIYILFAIIVVGVIGDGFSTLTAEQKIASIALGLFVGEKINLLANFFAVFSMATSFLALGLALRWVFEYDYNISKKVSWAVTCFIPLGIALSGVAGFIKILGFVGAIAGGIDGILIVLIHRKAKTLGDRKPEYSLPSNLFLSIILIALFVIGIIKVLI